MNCKPNIWNPSVLQYTGIKRKKVYFYFISKWSADALLCAGSQLIHMLVLRIA